MRAIGGYRHLMRQSLTVAPRASQDGYGKPTYGVAVRYDCRLVNKRKLVIGSDGTQITSTITAYLNTNVAIEPDALVTLSTGDVGSTESYALTPKILDVRRYPGDVGWHSTVLYL